MIAWGFQTAGVLLGPPVGFAVLGWGGYWGWDPVENASLLPWLTGTAFLRSVMQEKRGMMKVWERLAGISDVHAVHFGHDVDAAKLSSVHAFAQSSIGNWFVGFLGLILAVCLAAYVKNRDYLRSEKSAGFGCVAVVEFPVQQFDFAGFVRGGLSGTLFPVFRSGCRDRGLASGRRFLTR